MLTKTANEFFNDKEAYATSTSKFSPCCGASQKQWTLTTSNMEVLRQCHSCGRFNGEGRLEILNALKDWIDSPIRAVSPSCTCGEGEACSSCAEVPATPPQMTPEALEEQRRITAKNDAKERVRLGYDPLAHEQNMQWLKEREAERLNQPPAQHDPEALVINSVEELIADDRGELQREVVTGRVSYVGLDVDDLVNEVDRRKDAVVDAAVKWYESSQEGRSEDWSITGEALDNAIYSLLELRGERAQIEIGLTISDVIERGWIACPKCYAKRAVDTKGDVSSCEFCGDSPPYWNVFVQQQ